MGDRDERESILWRCAFALDADEARELVTWLKGEIAYTRNTLEHYEAQLADAERDLKKAEDAARQAALSAREGT